jgi:tripartite-type tricarboxylate transporter receptor subunit TctC
MVFGDPVSVLAHLEAGTLRGLAVTSKERSPVAPDRREWLSRIDAIGWHSILVPAGTPPAIIAQLHADAASDIGQTI